MAPQFLFFLRLKYNVHTEKWVWKRCIRCRKSIFSKSSLVTLPFLNHLQRQPLFAVPSPYSSHPALELQINEVTQHVVFRVGLLLLSLMFLKWTHFVTYFKSKPLCEYTTICFSIFPLTNICVIFSSELLWLKLPSVLLYEFFVNFLFQFSWTRIRIIRL